MYMYLYMYVYVYKNKALLDYFLSFVMRKKKKIYDGAAVGILRRQTRMQFRWSTDLYICGIMTKQTKSIWENSAQFKFFDV